ncbi:hypothetical protein HDU96_004697 [Phlyctochytrium bullatum]|nr:hypothetical protein HDU96_004697 [Phlyctochytrium bullatum]
MPPTTDTTKPALHLTLSPDPDPGTSRFPPPALTFALYRDAGKRILAGLGVFALAAVLVFEVGWGLRCAGVAAAMEVAEEVGASQTNETVGGGGNGLPLWGINYGPRISSSTPPYLPTCLPRAQILADVRRIATTLAPRIKTFRLLDVDANAAAAFPGVSTLACHDAQEIVSAAAEVGGVDVWLGMWVDKAAPVTGPGAPWPPAPFMGATFGGDRRARAEVMEGVGEGELEKYLADETVWSEERELVRLLAYHRDEFLNVVRAIIVGSEVIFRNDQPLDGVIQRVRRVRGILERYGISTDPSNPDRIVVTVADLAGPYYPDPLIREVDVVMVNVYPYWERVAISRATPHQLSLMDAMHVRTSQLVLQARGAAVGAPPPGPIPAGPAAGAGPAAPTPASPTPEDRLARAVFPLRAVGNVRTELGARVKLGLAAAPPPGGVVGRTNDVMMPVPVVFGEVGWPTEGEALGGAVPSIDNLKAALKEWTCKSKARDVPYFWFEYCDEK